MSDKYKLDLKKTVKNPLLSGAADNLDQFSDLALLLAPQPPQQGGAEGDGKEKSVIEREDSGELSEVPLQNTVTWYDPSRVGGEVIAPSSLEQETGSSSSSSSSWRPPTSSSSSPRSSLTSALATPVTLTSPSSSCSALPLSSSPFTSFSSSSITSVSPSSLPLLNFPSPSVSSHSLVQGGSYCPPQPVSLFAPSAPPTLASRPPVASIAPSRIPSYIPPTEASVPPTNYFIPTTSSLGPRPTPPSSDITFFTSTGSSVSSGTPPPLVSPPSSGVPPYVIPSSGPPVASVPPQTFFTPHPGRAQHSPQPPPSTTTAGPPVALIGPPPTRGFTPSVQPSAAPSSTSSAPPISYFNPPPPNHGPPVATIGPAPSSFFVPSVSSADQPDSKPSSTNPPSTLTFFTPPPGSQGPPIASIGPAPSSFFNSSVSSEHPFLSSTPSSVSTVPPPPSSSTATSVGAPPSVSNLPPLASSAPPLTSNAPPLASAAFTTSSATPPTSFAAPPTSFTAPPSSSTAPPTSFTPPLTSSTAPPPSFSAPPSSSTAPTSFAAPPTSSTAPLPSFSAPPTSSAAPSTCFTAPPTSSTAPPTSFSAPLTSFTVPPSSFAAPPTASTAPPPVTYFTPPSSSTFTPLKSVSPSPAPPTSFSAPPTSFGAPPNSTAPPSSFTAPPPVSYFTPPSSSTFTPFKSVSPSPAPHPSSLFAPPKPQSPSPVPPSNNSFPPQQPLPTSAAPPPNFFNPGKPAAAPGPPPPASAPPKGIGGAGNNYRLGNLKRPVYAPVPDLEVTSRMSNPTTNETVPGQPPQVFFPQPEPTPIAPAPTESPTSPTYSANTVQGMTYRPVYHHWFYRKGSDSSRNYWEPFSMADSLNLEQAFQNSAELNENTKVATDGGRYDVRIMTREKIPVYWEEEPGEVRRCSWFVRGPGSARYIPYDENIAALLEEQYKISSTRNEWNRRVELADGEVIILHGPNAIAHHQRSSSPDPWGNPPPMQYKPRVVKRGMDEFDIPEGEPIQVDHLLLVVHGIGKVCDLRFRSLVEVVDDFRGVSLQLIQSHFKGAGERGQVGRVEILPVEWHRALHTEAIDQRLIDITLPSIPKAREFTNETLLDILFYTSPVFCEKIVQAVGGELNRVYSLYMERNPGFKGGVSLGGHSLGSLILFDMLCHQRPPSSHVKVQSQISDDQGEDDEVPETGHLGCLKTKARLSRRMSYLTIGSAGTGQPYIMYPQLFFQPKAFFALGSPIGMFVTVRGIENLGEDFKFPTCPAFFNIFHPNDPVAYRIEALISPEMAKVPAVLIPHHKGRKRMHLELKDTMAHVTAALKQKIIDSVRSTWNTVYQLAVFHKSNQTIENEVNKVIEDEMVKSGSSGGEEEGSVTDVLEGDEGAGLDLKVGTLNGGRRIDYVLQESPLETFNQYISAVRSHVVYWESEDTILMVLKELYQTMGISPDSQVAQQILPFDITVEETETAAAQAMSDYKESCQFLETALGMGPASALQLASTPLNK